MSEEQVTKFQDSIWIEKEYFTIIIHNDGTIELNINSPSLSDHVFVDAKIVFDNIKDMNKNF